ncbi:MAG: hypothetical protein AUH29_03545 [Candidatus Rokubacteria bacterium 13_1_40CM_69_27]|nr:MAG: hypothetical protein AUH29_03545 [Candidatus Rokubacteria bacterium 13_1_40CM_69_27]
MVHRWVALLSLVGLALLGGLAWTPPAWSETLVQSTLDSRIALAFRVKAEELQRLVPASWQISPAGTGPSKDANLTVTFAERLLDQDGQGKPVAVATYRLVALSTQVKHPQTGEAGPMSIRVFSSTPDGVPGFYKTAVQATVRREQTVKGIGVEPGAVVETWEMRNGSGGTIELKVQYTRATPSRAKGEAKPRSSVDPAIWRIYRFEQAVDVLRSIPAGIDRVQSYQLRVNVPEIGKLFDGSEQLVSISAVPVYTRQTFLP